MARRKITAQEKKFGQRLRAARDNASKKQPEVAEAFGITVQAVSGWERGATRPEPDKLVRLADLYGVTLDTLMGASNNHRRKSDSVPVISYIQAGAWTEHTAYRSGDRHVSTDMPVSTDAFALEITGPSMLPRFRPGDIVIIDPQLDPEPGDFVAAKLQDEEETTFKEYRIKSHNPKVIELHALSEAHGFHVLSDERPGRIIGPMVEHHSYRRSK